MNAKYELLNRNNNLEPFALSLKYITIWKSQKPSTERETYISSVGQQKGKGVWIRIRRETIETNSRYASSDIYSEQHLETFRIPNTNTKSLDEKE